MSTRACVHFCHDDKSTAAIIYRHSDGYPDGLGEDLKIFLKEVKDNVEDNRFGDPNYLAAKFVVWQAKQYASDKHYLDFLSIGVMLRDAGDIEYRYKVICNKGWNSKQIPEIIIEKV